MRASWVLLIVAACGGESSTGGDGGTTTAHVFCVDETNRYRTMNGRSQLAHSAQLETFANTGAMVDFNGQPHDHFPQTQGGGIAFAENECPHWNLGMAGGDMKQLVEQCIAAFFAEGPGTGAAHGHYNNMMGNYAALGCGIYQSGSSVTIVQDYGN